MSHSSFKLIANDEPMSQNLIIVVNKNGSVGTDTATLQNLLTSKDTPRTGVTVLRETSPTPSITDEIDEERSQHFEMLKQEYASEHPNAKDEDIEEYLKTMASATTKIPHVTLSVENFYTPDQARKFANDVLHLGGIDNPQTLVPIDFNFRRQIIQNDHCYTPLTMSPEQIDKAKKKDPAKLVKPTKKVAKPSAKAGQSSAVESEVFDSSSSDEDDVEGEEDSVEEDLSYSESDDDNDMDFSVNDRFGKKGTKKKRKYRRQKQKNLTFKDFLLEGGAAAELSDEEPKKKYGKLVPKKTPSAPVRPSAGTAKGSGLNKLAQTGAKKVQAEKAPKSSPQPKFVPSSTFKAATTTASGNISQISIQSAAPTKSIQEMEIVESIAKDLEKSFPESIAMSAQKKPQHIPNIMQIMEQNTSAEVLDQSLASLEHIDGADSGASIAEIMEPLIAVLGNDALDELLNQNDLMNFEQNPTISKPLQLQLVPILADVVTSPAASPSPPKILNKQAPQKDPIKIVKNGRVITLPVIEAPATRGAKRRAQGDPATPVATTPTNKTIKAEKTPSNKDPDSRNSSRRSSLNKSESRRQSVAGAEADVNSDASWKSEDDPDRLWCICKQPHNNRFMICCDKCEDWFHGTCVNVTKAQGKVMEENNKKWLCPNCKTGSVAKKDPNKKALNQLKLTKFFNKHQKESTDEDVPKTNFCVACVKKPARPDSIYCSDECIQNHVSKHQTKQNSSKPPAKASQSPGQPGEVKRGNILKNQEGNVIVYDKTTEKLISSKLWPHISVLHQWLAQNPNCEPVRPGTNKANILMASISNKKQLSSALQTPTISSTTPPVKTEPVDELFSNPVKINTGNAVTSPVPSTPPSSSSKKLNRSQNVTSPNSLSSNKGAKVATSTSSISSSALPTHSSKRSEEKKIKRQTSDERLPSSSPSTSTKAKVELERQNVRNNFRTTLEMRMKQFEHPTISKMTAEEIEQFARHLELEMFLFFNKDTKDKYKTKFRSLKFNLSDVKNKSLIEKICAKKLTPKQLATVQAAALASEELAKWREDENKHQLEIITKSELDALSQNKIVVKTHKGEEIIETNPAPTEILMPGLDEDVEATKTGSLDDSHGRQSSPLSSPSISSSTNRARRSRSRSRSRDRHHSHHYKSSSSKHKKRSRSKSRDHHHSRSRDKSRDKSRNRSRHRDEKHHGDKTSTSSKAKESDSKKGHSQHHSKEQVKDKKPREIQPQQEDVDLVGKILDSMGVHLQPKKTPDEVVAAEKSETAADAKIVEVEPINEHKLEIEIYSGTMFMAEIAKFDVTSSVVSGNVDDIMKKLPSTMEIVGRIEPSTVWDYLSKVKKMPGKELIVLRFSSTNESAYFTLFSYLHTRQRYGVIKSPCPAIKDFYLITVEASRPLPNVLLPIEGPGFIEGSEHKPDLLIGVILKILPELKHVKRPSKEPTKKSIKPSRAPVEHIVPIEILPPRHKSHHQSGSSSKLVLGLPEINDDLKQSSPSPSDDEPYEPMDEDILGPSSSGSKLNISDDLETQMEQINREIEQRQIEIQKMAQQNAMELDEAQASRIYEKISVPHNLSEILSTIKASSESKPMEIDDDDDLEYVPMSTTAQSTTAEYRASATINPQIVNSMMDIDERIHLFRAQEMASQPPQPSISRLSQMTEADLMNLVPDNAFELAVPPPPIISGGNNESAIPGLEYDNMEN